MGFVVLILIIFPLVYILNPRLGLMALFISIVVLYRKRTRRKRVRRARNERLRGFTSWEDPWKTGGWEPDEG
jgi:hypothetical protein